jgi:phage protein D
MSVESQYAPDFKIKINGENLPPPIRASIMSVRYDNSAGEMDRVEVQLADPGLRWLEHPLLSLYHGLALSVGYAGAPLQEVFVGEITGRQASFSGGATTMTVEASDLSHRLMRGQKERSFSLSPDPAIVLFVAIENGLVPLRDPGAGAVLSALSALLGKPRFQPNQSDYEFLKKMAADSGVRFSVEKGTLFFKAFKESVPSVTLTWGRDLMDFSPRLSVVGQVEGVSVKIWLRELKMSFVVSVCWDSDDERFAISIVPGMAAGVVPGKPTFKLVDQPIKDPTDVAKVLQKAFSELKHKLNSRLTGSGSAIGNPDIRAGTVMRLAGLGSGFSGNYRVESASHTLDSSGYKTGFNVKREVVPEVFA